MDAYHDTRSVIFWWARKQENYDIATQWLFLTLYGDISDLFNILNMPISCKVLTYLIELTSHIGVLMGKENGLMLNDQLS